MLYEVITKNSGNYSNMDDIFKSLQSLTVEEKDLYQSFLEHSHFSKSVGYLISYNFV